MRRVLLAGGLGVVVALSAPAFAQAEQAGPLEPRTGPAAAPPPAPPYATPPSAGSLVPTQPPTSPAPSSAPVSAAGPGVTFSDVRVYAPMAGLAKQRPEWRPEPDPVSGVQLEPPGPGGFDADWVRRQALRNGLVGAPVPLDRVTAVVQAINLAFVRNGYINSGVLLSDATPPEGGVLALTLVYGRLAGSSPGAAAVEVAWGAGGARGLRRAYVTNRLGAAEGAPLNAIDVERQFRLLAEDPAIGTVNAEMRPGARSGEAGLRLTVVPAPRYDLYLSAANSRSPSIGGEREAIGGSVRNVLAPGDLLSGEAGVTASRPDYALSYETPIFSPRTTAAIRGSYSDAAVVDRPLVPLDIRAREWSVEGGLTQTVFATPLIPREGGGWSSARRLTLGARISHRRTETFLLGAPFSFSPGSVDGRAEYAAARLTADWVDRGVARVIAASLTFSQGLGGTGSDVPGVASPDGGFRALAAQASYARRLGDKGLELRLRFSGQWADGLLYSGERFAAGGEFTVRGYREALVLADEGAAASAELVRRFSLSRRGRDAAGVDWAAFAGSVFVDGAVLHNLSGPDPAPRTLGSVGASLAWVPSDAISARITYARALTDAPQVGDRDLQDRGVSFRVTLRPLLLFGRAG